MAKEKIDMHEELRSLEFDMGFLQKIECSKEDTKKYKAMLKNNEPLPEGIYQQRDSTSGDLIFYTIYKSELSEEEKQEYIQLKKTSYIETIKNCAIFFTVLTVISLVITFFFMLRFFGLAQ